ncbi:MAG: hypothetical protein BWZ10_00671 [candidate division BRC1 bacterium ADurb.BinA364]|nr:MAG: hypothetical protein BWZ10_00671 [candidate division BRC1 bacterium ADurb.BinA364]
MYAGDNHLPTIIHHGVDAWRDSGYSFTVPSIAAGFPRAWIPPEPGANHEPGMPPYTGDYRDGHGNKITMLAAANPMTWMYEGQAIEGNIQALDWKRSGYGFVRFDKPDRQIVIECWRILGDVSDPKTGQMPGWPMTISQLDNYGRAATAWLPTIRTQGLANPVLQVIQEGSGELVYALRMKDAEFDPKVFEEGAYTIRIGDQDAGRMREFKGVRAATEKGASALDVLFD